jgi:hypothetical protein
MKVVRPRSRIRTTCCSCACVNPRLTARTGRPAHAKMGGGRLSWDLELPDSASRHRVGEGGSGLRVGNASGLAKCPDPRAGISMPTPLVLQSCCAMPELMSRGPGTTASVRRVDMTWPRASSRPRTPGLHLDSQSGRRRHVHRHARSAHPHPNDGDQRRPREPSSYVCHPQPEQ